MPPLPWWAVALQTVSQNETFLPWVAFSQLFSHSNDKKSNCYNFWRSDPHNVTACLWIVHHTSITSVKGRSIFTKTMTGFHSSLIISKIFWHTLKTSHQIFSFLIYSLTLWLLNGNTGLKEGYRLLIRESAGAECPLLNAGSQAVSLVLWSSSQLYNSSFLPLRAFISRGRYVQKATWKWQPVNCPTVHWQVSQGCRV